MNAHLLSVPGANVNLKGGVFRRERSYCPFEVRLILLTWFRIVCIPIIEWKKKVIYLLPLLAGKKVNAGRTAGGGKFSCSGTWFSAEVENELLAGITLCRNTENRALVNHPSLFGLFATFFQRATSARRGYRTRMSTVRRQTSRSGPQKKRERKKSNC